MLTGVRSRVPEIVGLLLLLPEVGSESSEQLIVVLGLRQAQSDREDRNEESELK